MRWFKYFTRTGTYIYSISDKVVIDYIINNLGFYILFSECHTAFDPPTVYTWLCGPFKDRTCARTSFKEQGVNVGLCGDSMRIIDLRELFVEIKDDKSNIQD